jgi:hypothetical protein
VAYNLRDPKVVLQGNDLVLIAEAEKLPKSGFSQRVWLRDATSKFARAMD